LPLQSEYEDGILSSCFTKITRFNGWDLFERLSKAGSPERSATLKRTLVTGLSVACLTLLAAQAQAFGRRSCCDSCAPPCNYKVTYVDKEVTCYKPVWKEEKIKCVINKIVCREEIETRKCTVMVPKWTDVKKTCTYLVPVPKTVERDVLVCRMVPVQMTDECTGCTYTCYKPETVTQKVKCTVYECKEEKKDIMVRVCHYEPQEREYKVRRIIPECQQETVDRVRRYCVMTPYQTTIRVAVCVPCDD